MNYIGQEQVLTQGARDNCPVSSRACTFECSKLKPTFSLHLHETAETEFYLQVTEFGNEMLLSIILLS